MVEVLTDLSTIFVDNNKIEIDKTLTLYFVWVRYPRDPHFFVAQISEEKWLINYLQRAWKRTFLVGNKIVGYRLRMKRILKIKCSSL